MTDLIHYSRKALELVDLTSLNEADTEADIIRLCHQAKTAAGSTAAVCIYPQFIPIAKKTLLELGLERSVTVATVTNFPHGDENVQRAVAETRSAVAAGADEVDVVFPYKAFLDGDESVGKTLVEHCHEACGESVCLKVILETGKLDDQQKIRRASEIAIAAGADFIKTSTGKVSVNATLPTARTMLECIRQSGRTDVGFKAAGGIRTAQEAADYLALAEEIMGPNWIDRDHFRFGASSLLSDLLKTLGHSSAQVPENQY